MCGCILSHAYELEGPQRAIPANTLQAPDSYEGNRGAGVSEGIASVGSHQWITSHRPPTN